MSLVTNGPASAAIVAGAQVAGTAIGGPVGGAVVGMMAQFALGMFGGSSRWSATLDGTTYVDERDFIRALTKKNHKDYSEQVRISSGRTTRTSSFKQAIPPRRRVYGTVSQGAPLILHEVRSPFTYVGYALSDGPIVGVTHVSIGGTRWGISGTALTDPSVYSSFLLHIGQGIGDDAQAVNAMIADTSGIAPIAKPTTYRQRGVACMFARLHYGNDPNAGGDASGLVAHHNLLWAGKTVFECTIDGLVIDDLSGGDAHSSNSSRTLYDLLQCDWPGRIGVTEIDTASFVVAANDCQSFGFECNGVIYADDTAQASIQSILTTCDGALIRPDGQYKLKIDKASNSIITLTDRDILLGLEYSPDQALDDAPNIVRATYGGGVGEVIIDDPARLLIEAERQLGITFENVTSSQQTERLARRVMAKMNRPTLPIVVNDIASMLEIFDVITIDSASLPEASGEYKILSIDQEIVGASVLLREYSPNDYT